MNYLSMSREELEKLGFRRFNKDSGLMLIPLVLFREVLDSLPQGTLLTSIMGDSHPVGYYKFDDDDRLGLTAWGWVPPEPPPQE